MSKGNTHDVGTFGPQDPFGGVISGILPHQLKYGLVKGALQPLLLTDQYLSPVAAFQQPVNTSQWF